MSAFYYNYKVLQSNNIKLHKMCSSDCQHICANNKFLNIAHKEKQNTQKSEVHRESHCNTTLCQTHFLVAVWHLLPLNALSSACNAKNNPSCDLSKTVFLNRCAKPPIIHWYGCLRVWIGCWKRSVSIVAFSFKKSDTSTVTSPVKWWCKNWFRFWFSKDNSTTGRSWLSTLTVWTNQSFSVFGMNSHDAAVI